jgi:hypothetical protein
VIAKVLRKSQVNISQGAGDFLRRLPEDAPRRMDFVAAHDVAAARPEWRD